MSFEVDSTDTTGPEIPFDLFGHALDMLEPNEQAMAGRLICKAAWMRLNKPQQCTAQLSQPMPPNAGDAAWQPHLQPALQQLNFNDKLMLLPTAVETGTEANLQFAWGLLQQCVLPGALTSRSTACGPTFYLYGKDAGTTAVRSGHAHLLPWLVQHGCPLDCASTLEAAAEHCDVAGLQQAWELLGGASGSPRADGRQTLFCMLEAAGRVAGADVAKLSLLLSMADEDFMRRDRQRLLLSAAVGAAAGGSLPVLQWLEQQGMDLRSEQAQHKELAFSLLSDAALWCVVLAATLQHGHVAVADWLVDEAGCPLPQEEQARERRHAWEGAARGGSMEAMRWLLRRGVSLPRYTWAFCAAAQAGHLDVIHFLHGECGEGLSESAFAAAAGSRSLPTAMWLLQAGCPTDSRAYRDAAQAGDAAMVQWLALEVGCPWDEDTVWKVVKYWGARIGSSSSNSDLEAAVRALVQAGCPVTDIRCMYRLAARGNLPLLRYLHEELGLGFEEGILTTAVKGGWETVVAWLVGKGLLPCARWEDDAYAAAASKGNLGMLSCLRRLGVPWSEDTVWATVVMGNSQLPVVRWLVEQGAPLRKVVDAVGLGRTSEIRIWEGCKETEAWLEARIAELPMQERMAVTASNDVMEDFEW